MREYDNQQSNSEELDLRAQFGDLWVRLETELLAEAVELPEGLRSDRLFVALADELDGPTLAETEEPLDETLFLDEEDVVSPRTEPPVKGRTLSFYMPRVLAVAACFVLMLVGYSQVVKRDITDPSLVDPVGPHIAAARSDEGLLVGKGDAADDYGELRAALFDIQRDQGYYYYFDYNYDDVEMEEAADMAPQPESGGGLTGGSASISDRAFADSAPATPNVGGGGGESDAVYSTNTQVAGIDEADIIKTDGTYLYVYRFNQTSGSHEIAILEADGLNPMSTIDLGSWAYDGSLYLDGDQMVLVRTLTDTDDIELGEQARASVGSMAAATFQELEDFIAGRSAADSIAVMPSFGGYGDANVVEVAVYDITSREAPRRVNRYIQDGNYLTSRYMNGVVYTVTNKRVYDHVIYDDMPLARMVPMVGTGDSLEAVAAGDIIMAPYLTSPNYVTVTATDIKTGSRTAQSVLGMANEVYMSYNALYLTATSYNYNYGYGRDTKANETVVYSHTGIVKIDVDGTALGYVGGTLVEGAIDNQFSLDEYDGNLRIATTANTSKGTTNQLFVLDEKLAVIGSVTDLAPDERIYSVRYMGNMGYVVTFKQVDPLFAIDLSDPTNPKVLGELKIPGFSEYLHPIDENTLLGFGYHTVETEYGWTTQDGLKLSLFDVSDPTNPVETQNYLIGNSGSDSPALYNHKAFMYYPERSLVGLPVSVFTSTGNYSGGTTFTGLLLFEVDSDGFSLYGQIASKSGEEGFGRYNTQYAIQRGVYIGDVIYTFSDGCIMSHNLDAGLTQTGEYIFS